MNKLLPCWRARIEGGFRFGEENQKFSARRLGGGNGALRIKTVRKGATRTSGTKGSGCSRLSRVAIFGVIERIGLNGEVSVIHDIPGQRGDGGNH